jgi:hypothetical protein
MANTSPKTLMQRKNNSTKHDVDHGKSSAKVKVTIRIGKCSISDCTMNLHNLDPETAYAQPTMAKQMEVVSEWCAQEIVPRSQDTRESSNIAVTLADICATEKFAINFFVSVVAQAPNTPTQTPTAMTTPTTSIRADQTSIAKTANIANFNPIAARDIEPVTDASTCASGNQAEKGQAGVFTRKLKAAKNEHAQIPRHAQLRFAQSGRVQRTHMTYRKLQQEVTSITHSYDDNSYRTQKR